MTASNSKGTATADKNLKSNNNAEARRASKPLMEKRRRARINQSLAILKTLIVDSQKVEGQKHSKLEKADILEMTVSHLQSVKKSDEQKFMEGFEECFTQSVKFLEKSKINSSTIDKLAEHLKQIQSTLDTSAIFSHTTSGSPDGESSLSSPLDNRSVSAKLLKFTLGSDPEITKREENETSTSASLHIPRFPKLETPKGHGSPSSSCVSPLSVTISNDSNNNNNNFVSEPLSSPSAPGFIYQQQVKSETHVPSFQQQPLFSPRSGASHTSPHSNIGDEHYVLNLSTNRVPYTSFPNCPVDASGPHLDDPMDFGGEPLDFNRPLNLSKHPIGYRLSDDGVWRPW